MDRWEFNERVAVPQTQFEVLKGCVVMYAALGTIVGNIRVNFTIDAVQAYIRSPKP